MKTELKAELLADSIKKIDPELVNAARQAGRETSGGQWSHKYVLAAVVAVVLVAAGIVAGLIIGSRTRGKSSRDPLDAALTEQPEDTTAPTEGRRLSYSPSYSKNSALHKNEFRALLSRNGYLSDGVIVTDYNTGKIEAVFNNTPEGILNDASGELELFYVEPGGHEFLKYKDTIIRADTFGGRYLQLYLWDYDGNGVKDLFEYYTFGSGMYYLGCSLLDLATFESKLLITRNGTAGEKLTVNLENGDIFVDDVKLEYSDGRFNIDMLGHMVPGDKFFAASEAGEKPFEFAIEDGCIRLIRAYDVPEVTVWSEGYGVRREDNGPTDLAVKYDTFNITLLRFLFFGILSDDPLDTSGHANDDPPVISIMLSTPSDRPLSYKYRIDLYENYGAPYAKFIDLMTQKEIGTIVLDDSECHSVFSAFAPLFGFGIGLPEAADVVRVEVSSLPGSEKTHHTLTDRNVINSFVLKFHSLQMVPTENDGFQDGLTRVIELYTADGASSTLYYMGDRIQYGGVYYRIDRKECEILDNAISALD
ncbi:MAG: hypothetical protein J5950_05490 [Clostridia bacterium]|nr:hypothetical protein [Clostridia bacterium]